MSDDTPTERFEPPTTPLPAADGTTSATAEKPAESPKRGMLIALIAVTSAILIALIVLIAVLVRDAGGSDEAAPEPQPSSSENTEPDETESPEPSDEPSESPTTAPPPPPSLSPTFATFSGPNRADCTDTTGSVTMTWSWSSTDAENAWFGIGTDDAKAEPYEQVPTTATYTFTYQCSEASQIYTVTLEDAAGRLAHQTVEVVRE